MFYSISNCQPGLRGISFGNFLIKQVVQDLRRDFPQLKTFVTLSPVPGFAAWLKAARACNASPTLSEDDRDDLKGLDTIAWARDEVYDLERIEQNHEQFENRGSIAASRAVERLLRERSRPR